MKVVRVVAIAVVAGPLLSRTDKYMNIYQSFISTPILCQFFRGEHMEDFLFGLLSSVFCYVNAPTPYLCACGVFMVHVCIVHLGLWYSHICVHIHVKTEVSVFLYLGF